MNMYDSIAKVNVLPANLNHVSSFILKVTFTWKEVREKNQEGAKRNVVLVNKQRSVSGHQNYVLRGYAEWLYDSMQK